MPVNEHDVDPPAVPAEVELPLPRAVLDRVLWPVFRMNPVSLPPSVSQAVAVCEQEDVAGPAHPRQLPGRRIAPRVDDPREHPAVEDIPHPNFWTDQVIPVAECRCAADVLARLTWTGEQAEGLIRVEQFPERRLTPSP